MINISEISARRNELQQLIKMHRHNIWLLLDFAVGFKRLLKPPILLMRFQLDDFRLISTLKNLHSQVRELQKEYRLLNKMLKNMEKK